MSAGACRGPLHGIPLAYKDLCHVPGLPSSCGTATREYFAHPEGCTAAARLARAGAITLGKLNMTELALGPFGENDHHGDVGNPWRRGHVSGGSSSGSAAAVAAGFALGTLGSDTGGSIRLPAACCGIVGLKPTYGRVAMYPVSVSELVTHYGPMARTVRDTATLLQAIAGPDPRDPHCLPASDEDYLASCEGGVGGLRIAFSSDLGYAQVNPETASIVADAVKRGAVAILAAPDADLPGDLVLPREVRVLLVDLRADGVGGL